MGTCTAILPALDIFGVRRVQFTQHRMYIEVVADGKFPFGSSLLYQNLLWLARYLW